MSTFWAGLSRKAKIYIIAGSAAVLLLIIIIASCAGGGGGSAALSPKTATTQQICQASVGKTWQRDPGSDPVSDPVTVVTAVVPPSYGSTQLNWNYYPVQHLSNGDAEVGCTMSAWTANGVPDEQGSFPIDFHVVLTPNGQIIPGNSSVHS